MALRKAIERDKTIQIQTIILYIMVVLFVISFISSIIIYIILASSSYDLAVSENSEGLNEIREKRILGQFDTISTSILLVGVPFLILITTISYAFYISASGIKDKLLVF